MGKQPPSLGLGLHREGVGFISNQKPEEGRTLGAWAQTTEEEALSGVGADASRPQRRDPLQSCDRDLKREKVLDSLPLRGCSDGVLKTQGENLEIRVPYCCWNQLPTAAARGQLSSLALSHVLMAFVQFPACFLMFIELLETGGLSFLLNLVKFQSLLFFFFCPSCLLSLGDYNFTCARPFEVFPRSLVLC